MKTISISYEPPAYNLRLNGEFDRGAALKEVQIKFYIPISNTVLKVTEEHTLAPHRALFKLISLDTIEYLYMEDIKKPLQKSLKHVKRCMLRPDTFRMILLKNQTDSSGPV